MDSEGIEEVNSILTNLKPSGEPNINCGISLALKALKERNHKNQISSIFLISDGDNNNTGNLLKIQNTVHMYKGVGDYSINVFGFGSKHN